MPSVLTKIATQWRCLLENCSFGVGFVELATIWFIYLGQQWRWPNIQMRISCLGGCRNRVIFFIGQSLEMLGTGWRGYRSTAWAIGHASADPFDCVLCVCIENEEWIKHSKAYNKADEQIIEIRNKNKKSETARSQVARSKWGSSSDAIATLVFEAESWNLKAQNLILMCLRMWPLCASSDMSSYMSLLKILRFLEAY